MNLYRLAEERGYVVKEVEVAIKEGEFRPGWLVYDSSDGTFVTEAVDWTTADEVRAYIEEASG